MANKRITMPIHIPLYEQTEAYLDWCVSAGQTSVTVEAKRWQYAKFYIETGCKDLTKLDNALWNNYIHQRREHCRIPGGGAVSCNHSISAFRVLIQWSREMGLTVPIKLVLMEKCPVEEHEQVFYSRKTIQAAAKVADQEARLMIHIAFDTGMRASELGRLRLSEINGSKLTFRAKSHQERVTFISRETRKELDEWIEWKGIKDYVFPGGHEGHVAYNTLRHRLEKPFREIGITDFHPHAIRHSYVADLEEQGANFDEIRVLIGHASMKSTMRYVHRIRNAKKIMELQKKYHKL